MFGIFVVALIILVIAFVVGLVVSGKDYAQSDSRKYTDDVSTLFDDEVKNKKLNDIVPGTTRSEEKEEVVNEELMDDELI